MTGIPSMSSHDPTPRERGYTMPAEWEPHAGTWVSWPHNRDSWPGRFDRVPPVYARFVATLSRYEPVHVNVADAAMEAAARAFLEPYAPLGAIRFHHIPTNDAWCRDHGAILLVNRTPETGEPPRLATDWRYNAWGGKYPPYDLDNDVPRRMAELLDVPRTAVDMVLEGGSIDVNGRGLLLTTESCLLNPNRNPSLSREEIETRLRDHLGIDRVLWLGDGIAGDDTDGHIDDLARFVDERTIVTTIEDDPGDVNHEPLAANLERLRNFTDGLSDDGGEPLRIETLPMPRGLHQDGQRLPATYANFYIANGVVLVPFYDPDRDDEARTTLARLFPDREVIGIDCTDIIWGLGAFHCLTQQIPAGPPTSSR